MRVLAAAVLSMESILMGFALLIAKDEASAIQIAIGGALAIALILNAGVLKRKGGYLLGSILQISLIGYGYVVSQMYYMGALFAGLWIAAIVLGRKGEAIKARLIEQRDKKGSNQP
ncbi:unannotated protein [freshwater metagenome]|jgi:hypothetical protein|uniref:Unannotated protein n=1 Tax=freshwater metagenome TaxID=449393 RepID=A0A6J7G1X4_9ZZZZ|nr:DUF4233 domain-containing protein [Actinomycetota bacterium]